MKNSSLRQPCPSNVLFHDVFVKIGHKILNKHFYKPTQSDHAYADFNRHVASHLLKSNDFATKQNCIRLFLLLDAMTEIYLYESRKKDARFNLTDAEMSEDLNIFYAVYRNNSNDTPEHLMLGKNTTKP